MYLSVYMMYIHLYLHLSPILIGDLQNKRQSYLMRAEFVLKTESGCPRDSKVPKDPKFLSFFPSLGPG